jgi:hypothetical protein
MDMKNQFLLVVLLVEIAIGLVGYSATLTHELKPVTQLVVAEVLSEATWKDQRNNPGWTLLTTKDGETMLSIHGSEEGKVQLWPNEIVPVDHAIQYINYFSNVEITKVMCCFPKRVKKTCTEKVSFFCEDCDGCVWADSNISAGSTLRIWDCNPN